MRSRSCCVAEADIQIREERSDLMNYDWKGESCWGGMVEAARTARVDRVDRGARTFERMRREGRGRKRTSRLSKFEDGYSRTLTYIVRVVGPEMTKEGWKCMLRY